MEQFIVYIVQSVIAGMVAGVAFWATVKTEIKYLRRDVDKVQEEFDDHIKGVHHGRA